MKQVALKGRFGEFGGRYVPETLMPALEELEGAPPTAERIEVVPNAVSADHYLELLAGNLGITVEELEGALTQSHLDLIDEKVADGTITEEEAAEIIERITGSSWGKETAQPH